MLALTREVPEELYPQIVQDYCNQFFVSKGMIVDFAIYDPKPPGRVGRIQQGVPFFEKAWC